MTDEEKKEAIAEAKDLYKNGKAKKNERVFTLRNITDEEFVKLNKIDKKYFYSSIDSKENWYNQRYKQLREMLKAFDVWEEFTGLKHKGEFYSFSQRNMEFLMMLFREYNGKFEHLKRGKVANSDGAYLLMVYNGILDIFYDANAPERLIESVMLKLWNRLNIPQRNIDASIDSVCEQCKRMVKKNIESNSYGMGLMEKLLWQAAFRRSFYRFLLYRDSIYSNMENILEQRTITPEQCPFTCPYYTNKAPRIKYHKGMLPKTDALLARSINISIGVPDPGLRSSFGVNMNDGLDVVEQRANQFCEIASKYLK